MLVENKEKELGLKAWQRSGGRILTLHLSSLLAVQLQLICAVVVGHLVTQTYTDKASTCFD